MRVKIDSKRRYSPTVCKDYVRGDNPVRVIDDFIDDLDRQDDDVVEAKTTRLQEKIEGRRRQMQSLKEMGKQIEASPDTGKRSKLR